MFSVWLVFTSNLNSQTTWLKVKFAFVNWIRLSCYPRSADAAMPPYLRLLALRGASLSLVGPLSATPVDFS